MGKNTTTAGTILIGLFLIFWKLILLVLLIASRIVIMVFSIMNSKIEKYLDVQHKTL